MIIELKKILTIIKENGFRWSVDRVLYSAKLACLNIFPFTEMFYEKNVNLPFRLDIFEFDVDRLKRFLCCHTEKEKKLIIASADNAIRGKIRGFSSVWLDYGYPIDWQLNPLTGKRCDINQKWFRIPDFDEDRGDIKIIWEISRFSHFLLFARAYLITENPVYYLAFSEQLKDWVEKNPYSFGANYKCGQECAIRMINTLLAYHVFLMAGVADSGDENYVRQLVDRCYRRILCNFFYAYKCIKNNHTISELAGMAVGAWCCRDEKRLEFSYRVLNKVIDQQFYQDGGYRQHSFNYQRLALQDLECMISIGRATGKKLNMKSLDKILKSATLLYQCQDESGNMPNYGSNDGALIFPVTSCDYLDYRPVINTVYALITGERRYPPGIYDEEYLWFGEKRLEDLEEIRTERVSMQFPDAGLFTLRSNQSWIMAVLNDYHDRPAHMDQQHIDLWVGGVNVLCDLGTYSYSSEIGKKLSSTESHNTAKVRGLEQMDSWGAFMVTDRSERAGYRWKLNNFSGRMVSKHGYAHDRRIRRTGEGYILTDKIVKVKDQAIDGDIPFEVLFHTPCEVKNLGRCINLISSGEGQICSIDVGENEFRIYRSERSLYYLKTEEINVIAVKGRTGRPVITKIIMAKGQ